MTYAHDKEEVKYLEDDFLLLKENFNTHVIEYQTTELHNHSFYEIVYVINGTVTHICNGKESTLTTCDAVLLRPEKDTHTYKNIGDKNFLHRDLLIGAPLFQKVCDFLSPNLFQIINESPTPFILRLDMDRILFFEKELFHLGYTSDQSLICAPVCLALLAQLLASVCESMSDASKKEYNWLERLINILNTAEHFAIPLPELLRQHFHYNHSYMCKVFKKNTGMTMTTYFNTAKLNYAKTLLLSTDYTINIIAEAVGFNNLSHFNHEFKKRFGIPPSDYRKQNKLQRINAEKSYPPPTPID